MKARDVMTPEPATCTKDTGLTDVARMMVDHDCGIIPVVENDQLVGVVTDRDIVCRTLARGRDPFELAAGDCLTVPAIAVGSDDDLETCMRLMEEHQVRRIFVRDGSGRCLGVISQADLATHTGEHQTGRVVREISQPAHA
jgi:CBS domain-containing protein